MSIIDFFNGKKYREENEQLRAELAQAQALLTPEMQDAEKLAKRVKEMNATLARFQNTIQDYYTKINGLDKTLSARKKDLLDIDDALLYQEFSLYKPKYDLVNSEAYKKRIEAIRQTQKALIKNGEAVSGSTNWMVNNSKAEGRRMVLDMQKLLLRAFNSECDELIQKVTYSNLDLSIARINKSCDAISKLGKIMSVAISSEYLQSKLEELYLVFEYQRAKQKEKEEQKELRAQMREEAKVQKELEEARKKAEKEHSHYLNALSVVRSQLETASEEQKPLLEKKLAELEETLQGIEKNIADIDYREANAKAGYVYIISNIGAFGENIYKIGMTRRLEPMERIDELGDASVPFDFDVHAMIFSSDAPALESALHKAFESKKLNMVNTRREFFAVTLDEIKQVVHANYNDTVEFIDAAPAQQFRESQKIKQST